MEVKKREGNKKFSIKRTLLAFQYSWEGFKYAYRYEQSMALHVVATVLVLIFGFALKINRYEWFFVIILVGLINGIELLNTSIEAVVDLITDKHHPLAKIAKDTASAAVLSLSIVAFIGASIIFLPRIIALF